MEEKEKRIVEGAISVFMKLGIKSVNMDDLSRQLNISKKTLYQVVTDKDDLVRKTMLLHNEKEELEVKAICERGLDAIDEQLEFMHWVLEMLNHVHPSIIFDLQKYHPEVFQEMRVHRQRSIYKCLMENMKKGQKEGLYRKDFIPEAIAKFYIARIDLLFDQSVFPDKEWQITQLYSELFKYHIRGIASSRGLEVLQERMKSVKF